MSETLPPDANLEQLRKQAKDLLKLHNAGNPETCGTLRLLRRFKQASDREILASDLALNEAQFALAMSYGFKGWPELKRHVESTRAPGHSAEMERDDGRTVLKGYEDIDWGRSRESIDNSFIRCLTHVLNAAGEDISYAELMGLSGAAFRVQVLQPELCPSAACAEVGIDCYKPALESVGYPMETIWMKVKADSGSMTDGTQVKSDPGSMTDVAPKTIERARKSVVESIERGRPAIYQVEEHSLIVGYRNAGQCFILREYCNTSGPGYTDKEPLPWSVSVVGDKKRTPDRRTEIIRSLRRGLEVANTAKSDNVACGFAAYKAWIQTIERGYGHLSDERAFGWLLGNAYCYESLFNSREAASDYLRSVSEELDEGASDRLLKAADLFSRLQKGLHAEWSCAPYPWWITEENPWTPERKARECQLLSEALEMDRMAFAEIEKAVAILS
jgi:hypothetical protein